MLSGSPTGNANETEMHSYMIPERKTDFTLEIIKWKNTSASEALVSGKFSGTLKDFSGAPDIKTENGSFSNVKVKVYNEKY